MTTATARLLVVLIAVVAGGVVLPGYMGRTAEILIIIASGIVAFDRLILYDPTPPHKHPDLS